MRITNEGTSDCFVLPVSDGSGLDICFGGGKETGDRSVHLRMCPLVCSLTAIIRRPTAITVTTVQIRAHLARKEKASFRYLPR